MPAKPDYQWIEISDFTPGIITNSNLSYAAGGGVGSVPGSKVGQAQSAVGCIGLPNGGLAPLPGIYTPPWNGGAANIPPLHSIATGTGSQNVIVGFFVGGNIFNNANNGGLAADELIIAQIADTGAGSQSIWIDSYQISNLVVAGIGSGGALSGTLFSQPTQATIGWPNFATMTGGLTRANATPTDVGNPCWVLEEWFRAGADNPTYGGYTYGFCYPDPTNPSGAGYAPYGLINSSTGYPGPFILHQNRIIKLRLIPSLWGGTGKDWWAAELFNYTEPPNSLSMGTQQEVFVQENPSGYGAWGSQSASELFLVKNSGSGGVVISGDLNSPTVTSLPGVTATGGIMSRGASTPIGFIYAVDQRGLWVWNGGNTSQKLSENLDDNSFVVTAMPPVFSGPTVQILQWGDWIIASNDWLYDTNTGGWWQLPPGFTGSPHIWYGTSYDGDKLYSCLPVPTATSMIDMYARSTPTNIYTWESYPIREPAMPRDRMMAVREVVIRAQGNGTVAVNITGWHGTVSNTYSSPSSTLNFNVDTFNQPQMQMMETGTFGGGGPYSGGPMVAQDITVEITSTGATATTPAPIVYSVSIGYQEQPAKVSAP